MVDNNEIQGIIYQSISETFNVNVDGINAKTVAADIDGWNSVTNTLLFLEIEERLKVELPIEILLEAADVGVLCSEIEAFMNALVNSKNGG